MLDLAIHGGRVISDSFSQEMDVGIENGTIVRLSEPGRLDESEEVINADGLFVFPGLIDAHVHVNVSLGEFTTKGDFEDVTKAAAFGGTTSIVDFAIPESGETPMEAFDRKRDAASANAYVDYSFHGCLKDADDDSLADVARLSEAGAASVKVFMVYRDLLRLSHGEIRDTMTRVAENDGVLFVHAEDQEIIERTTEHQVEAGETGPEGHFKAHPPVSETSAMWTIVDLVADTGCPAYFVHASTSGVENVLEYADNHNLPIHAETCPHYLALDESVYTTQDGYLFTCSPPIRDEEDVDSLWNLIKEGLIESVNSDHAAFDVEQKEKYREDFTKMPMGVAGVETRNTILYSEGVDEDRITPQKFVSLTSTNAAEILGLYPEKGSITIGTDADFTLWDPEEASTLAEDKLHQKTGYTPFEGFDIRGKPHSTIVRGDPVVRDGELVRREPKGQYTPTQGSD